MARRPQDGGPSRLSTATPHCVAAGRSGRQRVGMETFTVRLQRPEELLAAVPFQLGFHPHHSLVVIAVAGRRLVATVRIDLPEPDQVTDAVTSLVHPLLGQGCDAAVVAAYEDQPGEATDAVRILRRQLRQGGLRVLHTMVVRGDRWSEIGTGRTGRIPLDHPGLAPFVLVGRAPLPDRAAQARLVEPEDGMIATAVAEAVRSTRSRRGGRSRRRETGLWRALLDTSLGARDVGDFSAREVARLVCALSEIHWRDALVMCASPHVHPMAGLPPDVLADVEHVFAGAAPAVLGPAADDERLARLQALARRVPDTCADEVAEVCALIGSVAWAHGEGAAAGDAVQRALRVRPEHRLAGLVERLVGRGVRPPGRVAEAG